jgi:hypothetical protein
MLTYRGQAQAEGGTAPINTAIFPGISHSMARQAIAALDCSDKIQLSYDVGGSIRGITSLQKSLREY